MLRKKVGDSVKQGESLVTIYANRENVEDVKAKIYENMKISILMSISTALIGPLTFYGFLVATLSYQAASTYDHRYIFPLCC